MRVQVPESAPGKWMCVGIECSILLDEGFRIENTSRPLSGVHHLLGASSGSATRRVAQPWGIPLNLRKRARAPNLMREIIVSTGC